MDKIDKDSFSSSGVTFGECNARCLLFADDLALLSSNKSDFQYALNRFSDACLDAGMKISMTKAEIMYFSRHPVQCSFQTYGITLPQKEKFRYLEVTFSRDGRLGNKLDTCIEKAIAAMRQLYPLVVLKRELCTKAKLSVFRSVFVPILTYDHKCWVMTERVRSRVQVAEIVFLQKFRGLSLLDKVKSIDFRQSLNIEPLLLRIERSQLRWYGHVTQMSHERTAKQLMDAFPSGKRPRGRPRTCW